LFRRLGIESTVAPAYIYAVADTDKNGDISESEVEYLVRLMVDENFRVIDLLGNNSYSIQAIPLPNVVFELNNQSNSKKYPSVFSFISIGDG